MLARRTSVLAAAAIVAIPVLLSSCVVPSPSPGTNAALSDVAALSSTNAYAVGHFQDSTGRHDLMEHWNGSSWQSVFLPPPFGSALSSITAVSASNIWAVSDIRTLHFTGTAWRSLPNPTGITMQRIASGPDAAVYGLGNSSTFKTFLFLMTAGGWRQVAAVPTTPTSPGACAPGASGMSVVKANDVWISGDGNQCIGVLHWNGTTWSSAPMPAVTGRPQLQAVSALTDTDVWAVGYYETPETQNAPAEDHGLIVHWNGTDWTSVPTLDTSGGSILNAIQATPQGVWAVGTAALFGEFSAYMSIKKWNGTSMVDQSVQLLASSPPQDFAALFGVSVRDGVVTSVGFYSPRPGQASTVIDRRSSN